MKYFLMLSLFALVSCNQDDGRSSKELPPVGILNREWVPYAGDGDVTVQTVDLTEVGTIKITGLKRIVRKRSHIGNRLTVETYTSDCVYSITGETPVNGYLVYVETTLTSGDPLACDAFVPGLGVKHMRWDFNDFDSLYIGSNALK